MTAKLLGVLLVLNAIGLVSQVVARISGGWTTWSVVAVAANVLAIGILLWAYQSNRTTTGGAP